MLMYDHFACMEFLNTIPQARLVTVGNYNLQNLLNDLNVEKPHPSSDLNTLKATCFEI